MNSIANKTSNRPGRELDLFRSGLSSFFDSFFEGSSTWNDTCLWSPALDVEEKNDSIIVTAELPGLGRDDVSVTLEKGYLTISGTRNEDKRETRGRMVLTERSYGFFRRTIPLPEGINQDSVTADFASGVLKIVVPRTGEGKEKSIKVTVK